MHHLAVGSLPVYEEIERPSGKGKIPIAVYCVQGEERIASEKPAESRTGRISGFVISGYKARFRAVLHLHLVNGDFSPLQPFVDPTVWRLCRQSMIEKVRIVALRLRIELRDGRIDRRGLPVSGISV